MGSTADEMKQRNNQLTQRQGNGTHPIRTAKREKNEKKKMKIA